MNQSKTLYYNCMPNKELFFGTFYSAVSDYETALQLNRQVSTEYFVE